MTDVSIHIRCTSDNLSQVLRLLNAMDISIEGIRNVELPSPAPSSSPSTPPPFLNSPNALFCDEPEIAPFCFKRPKKPLARLASVVNPMDGMAYKRSREERQKQEERLQTIQKNRM